MAERGRPMPPMDDVEKKTQIMKKTSEGAINETTSTSAAMSDGMDGGGDLEMGGVGPQGREEKIVDWDGPDDPEVSLIIESKEAALFFLRSKTTKTC